MVDEALTQPLASRTRRSPATVPAPRRHPSSFLLDPWRDRGANIVEMAVVLPFLLLLLMGIADIGRAFYTYISLTNAAREGARFAARFPFQGSEGEIAQVVARVQDEPNIAGVSWDETVVTVDGLGGSSGQPVCVTASLELDTFLGSLIGLPSITVRTDAVMRIFGVDGLNP